MRARLAPGGDGAPGAGGAPGAAAGANGAPGPAPRSLVFANVHWIAPTRPGGPPRAGEIDLLVVDPAHGILVVEVKDGPVRLDGFGRWYAGERALDVSPFRQAETGKHAIAEHVAAHPDWIGPKPRMLHAVAFPDTDRASLLRAGRTDLGPDAPLDPLPEPAELEERREALRAYARRWQGEGHIVEDGLEGGRPANPADVARLAGPAVDGMPRGLRRCPDCGELRGERLRDEKLRIERLHGAGAGGENQRPEVVDVFCRCANHNRCAGCGGPLAEHRLSARYWDEADARAWYVAAYCGLGHRCPGRSPDVRSAVR